jgi:hypothetical protein
MQHRNLKQKRLTETAQNLRAHEFRVRVDRPAAQNRLGIRLFKV